MKEFTVMVDDDILSFHNTKKENIYRFLKTNFKENVHFIRKKIDRIHIGHGGGNKIDIYMTEETAQLLKNSYNLKHRYVTAFNNTEVKCIVMTIENSTIGFICNALKTLPIEFIRQHKIDKYKVDLFIPELSLVIECDEFGHINYNTESELQRTKCIVEMNYTIIRFNPNADTFDISNVISDILNIYQNVQKESFCNVRNSKNLT